MGVVIKFILATIIFGFSFIADSSHGSMYFTLQLTNYSNPTYTLNSTESLTCAPKFGQTLVSRCNFQFVTHISFENTPPVVIPTLVLIPPDNTSWIYFNNTLSVVNCPTPTITSRINCSDSTWSVPYTNATLRMPMSIEVVVTHFGDVSYQGNSIGFLLPSASWRADTFYINLRNYMPSASNISPIYNAITVNGINGVLGLNFSMQCYGGWYGPQCEFPACDVVQNGTWKCKTSNDSDYKFLCNNDTVTANPTQCTYCPNGVGGSECRSMSSGPTTYKSSTGLTAGIIVLAIIAAVELIIIVTAIIYIMKQKKQNQPPSSPTRTSNVRQTNGNNPKGGKYQKAPTTEREAEWPNNGHREYNPADEYSTPNRRNEAAV